ncbi:peptidoglycan recognition protein family protein [Streptomyces sp. BI20]|uniref:peptidoglycan recognition protein family protein n=1 Tax=Streptomyces sp. BI20 TaxID=3403460 RepID=UPI003C764B46
MRGFLASSIGVATAAALALPLALPSTALAVPGSSPAAPAEPAGTTQSLELLPLGPARGRSPGVPGMSAGARAAEVRGLTPRTVKTFSLVGVVWDDAGTQLHGRVQVRTRSATNAVWTDWQDLETHNGEHAADPDSAEHGGGRVRGSTAPLWVGASDGVEVRVQAEPGAEDHAPDQATPPDQAATPPAPPTPADQAAAPANQAATPPAPATPADQAAAPAAPAAPADQAPVSPAGQATAPVAPAGQAGQAAARSAARAARLPSGMRIELVDPGAPDPVTLIDPAKPGDSGDDKGAAAPAMSMEMAETSSANLPLAPLGANEIVALNKADSTADAVLAAGGSLDAAVRPYIGPRPRIVTRKGWGADESLREKGFVYTNTVKAAFVHHSASGNNYACADAPAVLRSLYRYHVVSSGWRDLGYNFAVDKCGTVYEGRAGGVAKPVLGAHTMGFNTDSMGIAVLGTFTDSAPPAAAVDAVARLTAWKLGLFGANPAAKTTLISAGGNRYKKGTGAKLDVISGHRDGFATECPGRLLYGKLPATRTTSAKLQGR